MDSPGHTRAEALLRLARAGSGDDRAFFERLMVQSFATVPAHAEVWAERVGLENLRVLWDGELRVGGLGIYAFGQWFGGRSIPCAGIAGVGIVPERRGGGLATQLMRRALTELAAEGVPLSALFPATLELYRRAGYEVAGGRYEVRVPCRALPRILGGARVEPIADVGDPRMRACYASAARRANGWIDRNEALWQRVREQRDEVRDGYAVIDGDRLTGYVWFARRPGQGTRTDIACVDLVALDARAADALLGFLGTHSSVVDHVTWFGGASDPWIERIPEIEWKTSLAQPWMLRVLDVRAALEARGFARALRGELHLDVADDLLEQNRGAFVLTIEGGRASVRPGGERKLAIDVRGLAALFSGWATAESLAFRGLARGPESELALATGLFAGPSPAMPDFF